MHLWWPKIKKLMGCYAPYVEAILFELQKQFGGHPNQLYVLHPGYHERTAFKSFFITSHEVKLRWIFLIILPLTKRRASSWKCGMWGPFVCFDTNHCFLVYRKIIHFASSTNVTQTFPTTLFSQRFFLSLLRIPFWWGHFFYPSMWRVMFLSSIETYHNH